MYTYIVHNGFRSGSMGLTLHSVEDHLQLCTLSAALLRRWNRSFLWRCPVSSQALEGDLHDQFGPTFEHLGAGKKLSPLQSIFLGWYQLVSPYSPKPILKTPNVLSRFWVNYATVENHPEMIHFSLMNYYIYIVPLKSPFWSVKSRFENLFNDG